MLKFPPRSKHLFYPVHFFFIAQESNYILTRELPTSLDLTPQAVCSDVFHWAKEAAVGLYTSKSEDAKHKECILANMLLVNDVII